MQEVRGFLVDGETDYLNLRGDTGPLVYPGGFVWIFSALYYMTDEGKNLRRGEWIYL
jgi:alpha-1,3-mannosyltransferase